MYYYIKNTLERTDTPDLSGGSGKFVAVLTSAQWLESRDRFDMGIEMDMDLSAIDSTKAEVNYDSLTGTFSVPDRENISAPNISFAFALDEKGIVFIDDSGFVSSTIGSIISSKRWAMPCMERFIYDFLEQIVSRDQNILQGVDKELDTIEYKILEGDENENDFFNEDNTRYFHLFSQRVSRLHNVTSSLRDYSIQIRELYQSQLDKKQNRIMTLLTVITSIFMPLTLIAGWYGMNFKYMPELEHEASYPIIIAVSIAIVIISLIFFKKKKWL